jgi:hypothetical protein
MKIYLEASMVMVLKSLPLFNKEVFYLSSEVQTPLPKPNQEQERQPPSQLEFSKELIANHHTYKH